MATKPTLPDDLRSRVSRIYIDERSFQNDKGENIDYERLVIEILVKNEPFTLEYKIEKKDKAVLALADVIDTDGFDGGNE